MWIDLTHSICHGALAWIGDPAPEIETCSSLADGDSCNTSILRFPSHLGTHMDAPRHFVADGKTLDQIDLDVLIGRARLLDFSPLERHISRKDLEKKQLAGVERILFKTRSGPWMRSDVFRSDYIAIDTGAAAYLVELGVKLAGIDYLSIEGFRAAGHPVHQSLLGNEVVVVEGLDLSQLHEGDWDMICLPLKIAGGDGSPCRALAKSI